MIFSVHKAAYMMVQLTALLVAVLVLGCAASASAAPAAPDAYWVYIGTFSSGQGQGIYVSRLDLQSGSLSEPRLVADAVEPNYLALHRKLPILYAVAGSRPPEKRQSGLAMSFKINAETGELHPINQLPTGGNEAVYIDTNPQGTAAIAAHYSSGSVISMKLAADGALTEISSRKEQTGSSINPRRQQHAFPHSITFDPAGHFAFSPDLGADKIFIYHVSNAELIPGETPYFTVAAGSGPRHMVFSANALHAYLVNELSSTISVLNYDSASGKLTLAQTITTLPADFSGSNTGADIRLHPNGHFLYASNRGHESIAIFAIHADGTLTAAGHTPVQVKMPRGFAIDPSGKCLIAAGQQSDTLALFGIDSDTGALTLKTQVKAPKPVCVTFFPVSHSGMTYNK